MEINRLSVLIIVEATPRKICVELKYRMVVPE